MRALRCTITFRDGAKLFATAKAATQESEVPVHYDGALMHFRQPSVDTLGPMSLGFLEWYLQARSMAIGATLQVQFEGEFEQYPELCLQMPGSINLPLAAVAIRSVAPSQLPPDAAV
jgi:hypothetical protein